jgi:predicted PurR-regulated permease PerM
MDMLGGAFSRERRLLAAFLLAGTLFFGLAGIAALVDVLSGFSDIFVTLFLAWLLAFLVSPLIKLFQRRFSMSHGGATATAFAVTILGLGIFLVFVAAIMWVDLQHFVDSWPSNQDRLEAEIAHLQDLTGIEEPNLIIVFEGAVSQVASLGGTLASSAGAIAGGAFSAIGSAVLIVLLSLFMAMDSDNIITWLSRLFPKGQQANVELFQHSVGRSFGGFIRTQSLMALIMFSLVFIVGLVVGMDYRFVAAFASGLLMFIPMIGPPLALIPPILFSVLFVEPIWLALVTVVIIAVVQTVLVNAIQPRMMQESLGLHPILLFVGLLVGVQIAGLWGALFGVPIVAIIAIFVRHWVDLYNPPEPEPAAVPPAAAT